MVRRKITLFAVAILMSVTMAFKSNGQETISKIQSLYIYNFAKYIQWSNPGDKFIIGIYSDNTSYNELANVLKNRKVGTRAFEVKKLSSPAEASSCHIVFINNSHSSSFKKIQATADLNNTLLVTARDMTDKGASISFILKDQKLKFKINQDACRASGLQVSNNLLALGA